MLHTLKCLGAKVEEHNPHISSIVFVYNSSYAEQIGTSEQNMYFWFSPQVGRHSPPTSMKYLAANPDRGADKDKGTKYVFISGAQVTLQTW